MKKFSIEPPGTHVPPTMQEFEGGPERPDADELIGMLDFIRLQLDAIDERLLGDVCGDDDAETSVANIKAQIDKCRAAHLPKDNLPMPRPDPTERRKNGLCPHDGRRCSFKPYREAGRRTPCGSDWCARQGDTDAHARIDIIEDTVEAAEAIKTLKEFVAKGRKQIPIAAADPPPWDKLRELADNWRTNPHEGGADAWHILVGCANDLDELIKELSTS